MGSSSLKREILGIALALFAVFLAGTLVALAVASGPHGASVQQSVGVVGDFIAAPLVSFFGWPSAVLIPLVPAVHALRLFGRLESETDRSWMIFFGGLVMLLPVALALTLPEPPKGLASPGAGWWGGLVAYWWHAWFGTFGAWVVLALLGSVLMAATLAWNPILAIIGHRRPVVTVVNEPETAATPKRRGKRAAGAASALAQDGNLAFALEPSPEEMPAMDVSLATGDASPSSEYADLFESDSKRRKKKSKAEVAADHDAGILAEIKQRAHVDGTGEELPSPELLAPVPPHNVDASKRELDAMGLKLMDALRTFKVDGELVGRTTGPVVSQFEIEPAPGVKVRQFANLSNDLALAMRAASIRIVAPIPPQYMISCNRCP